MHFHVTGTNHATGARMALDLAASNRADAERKAKAAGMDVQHVRQPASRRRPRRDHRRAPDREDAADPRHRHRGGVDRVVLLAGDDVMRHDL
jgi:hypothetical protein